MARHTAGDFPSTNIRTAPTPSEPNTPIAEGFSVANALPPQNQHPPALPEEPEAEILSPETEEQLLPPETEPQVSKEAETNSSSNEEVVSNRQVPEKEMVNSESRHENEETGRPESKKNSESRHENEETGRPENKNNSISSEEKVEDNKPQEVIITEKMSNLNTSSPLPAEKPQQQNVNNVAEKETVVDSTAEDRFGPPEDESVPEIEEDDHENEIGSSSAVVDNDEEDEDL